jgi:hypothetical protein
VLIIPLPTTNLAVLQVLITEAPDTSGTPACTPDLAALLLKRWHGAQLREDRDGTRYVSLPLTRARQAAA